MKILHVIPSVALTDGGPTRAMLTMERALAASGICLTTATTDDDGAGRRLTRNDREVRVNGVSRIYARKWFDFYKVAPGIVPWLWCNVRRFDTVHIHALFSFTSIAAGFIARLRGVPYVVRPLGTLTRYSVTQRRPWLKKLSLRLIETSILYHSAAVHFTSESEEREAISLGVPFKGRVIALGVEPPVIGDRQLLVRQFPIIMGRRTVLYLSRLDPKKNVEGLLKAFASVTRRKRDLVLMVAGDGNPDYLAGLRRLATSLGPDMSVVWLGHVEGLHKAAAFAVADVFVLPSLSENFGIAAAEALLAGLPCVLGKGVAIAGDAARAGAALVVDPEAQSIAAALDKILENDVLRREMGHCGRWFAEREYSTRAMSERLIALYEEIRVQRRRGRHDLS